MLVALLLLLIFTLRTTVVSIFSSISRPLAITIMTIVVSMVFINNPGGMANNTRMMITRLLFFMTIGLGHILAFLNIGNIYNDFIINIALFMLLFFYVPKGDFTRPVVTLARCKPLDLACFLSGLTATWY